MNANDALVTKKCFIVTDLLIERPREHSPPHCSDQKPQNIPASRHMPHTKADGSRATFFFWFPWTNVAIRRLSHRQAQPNERGADTSGATHTRANNKQNAAVLARAQPRAHHQNQLAKPTRPLPLDVNTPLPRHAAHVPTQRRCQPYPSSPWTEKRAFPPATTVLVATYLTSAPAPGTGAAASAIRGRAGASAARTPARRPLTCRGQPASNVGRNYQAIALKC